MTDFCSKGDICFDYLYGFIRLHKRSMMKIVINKFYINLPRF